MVGGAVGDVVRVGQMVCCCLRGWCLGTSRLAACLRRDFDGRVPRMLVWRKTRAGLRMMRWAGGAALVPTEVISALLPWMAGRCCGEESSDS